MASSEKKHGESLSLPHNRLAYARYATTYPARLLVRTVADRRGHSPSRLALYRAGKRVGRDAGSGAPSPRMARMACRVARGSPCRGNVLSAVRSAGLRSGRHIAVSHAGGYAALMLCDVPCGLDIERADRDFTKTEERFLAPDERKLLESAGGLSAGIVWCAKEALYKWSGLGRTRLAPRYPRHEDRSGPGNARRNGRRKAHRAESHPASRTAYRLLRRIAPAANRPQSGTPVWRCPFFLLTLSRRNH